MYREHSLSSTEPIPISTQSTQISSGVTVNMFTNCVSKSKVFRILILQFS